MKQFFLFTFFLGMSLASFGQNVDEIIANHIKAIGGTENWKKVNTMYTEANSDFGGTKLPIKMWAVNNKAMKVEFTVQGMTGIQVITDKAGWSLMPFMGQTKPEPTPEEQLKAGQSGLDLQSEFIDYAAKGSTVEYIGEDTEEGVEVYKIKLTDKTKTETTYFIDKESYYIIKETAKMTMQGQEVDNVTSYGNYKTVGNVVMPYTMTGMMGNMNIDKYDLNVAVDEKIFEMPKQ